MSFIYTQANLKSRINAGVQGKIGILLNAQDTMNAAVRSFFADVDLRSSKRKSVLSPNLFNGVFEYLCPADLKAQGIIDVPGQVKRSDGEWNLVPPEEFDRESSDKTGLIAIDDADGVRTLKLASAVESKSLVLAELDSLQSGGGTWSEFGDATGLAADVDDFIKGNGSLAFDLSAAGGTTAGIVNSTGNSLDLSDYFGGNGSIFVWARINSATNLTNYILRLGTDSSNYYQKTVTARADGTAFVSGWNLLKFDLSSLTTVGTPDNTDLGGYKAVYMTKTAGKISETDYKFDYMVVKKGVIHNVRYYTKYGWQSSAGAYKENSTDAGDLLVADTDEFELITKKGVIHAMEEIGFPQAEIDAKKESLDNDIRNYLQKNPSEAKIMGYDYYKY